MANPHKGEVGFKVDGKSYKLSFSANAICNLEDELGKTMAELGEVFADPKLLRMKDVRTMFVIAFDDAQDDPEAQAVALSLFKELDPPDALDIVVKAFNKSFGVDENQSGSANPQTPGAAANGTGALSTETGAVAG